MTRKFRRRGEENKRNTQTESYTVTKWTSPEERIGLLFDSDLAMVISNFGKRTTPALETWRVDQINVRLLSKTPTTVFNKAFNKLKPC